jgi:hypothetical protein
MIVNSIREKISFYVHRIHLFGTRPMYFSIICTHQLISSCLIYAIQVVMDWNA